MSDQPETLDKIIAEMHDFCSGWSEDVDVTVKVGLIYGWECRLDAAAERERNAHTNDIHNALYKATGISGNAAAMRDALESTEELLEHFAKPGTMLGDAFAFHMRDNRAALAVPARNCDRFASIGAAIDGFCREVQDWEDHDGIPEYYELAKWLFATAQEGGVR